MGKRGLLDFTKVIFFVWSLFYLLLLHPEPGCGIVAESNFPCGVAICHHLENFPADRNLERWCEFDNVSFFLDSSSAYPITFTRDFQDSEKWWHKIFFNGFHCWGIFSLVIAQASPKLQCFLVDLDVKAVNFGVLFSWGSVLDPAKLFIKANWLKNRVVGADSWVWDLEKESRGCYPLVFKIDSLKLLIPVLMFFRVLQLPLACGHCLYHQCYMEM